MDTKDFKKVARLLKTVYAEIEQQAIRSGVNITSPDYDKLIIEARNRVLENLGFTLDQYLLTKEKVASVTKEGTLSALENLTKEVEELKNLPYLTEDDVTQIAHSIAKQYVKPPVITNQIVKETTIEKPQIIKETRTEKIVETINYNEKPLREDLKKISDKVDAIILPDIQKLRDEMTAEFRSDFSKYFEHNINIMGMPDWRKLAMGLRQDIDALSSGSGGVTKEIPVGTVNGVNRVFTVSHTPKYVVIDNMTYTGGLQQVDGVTRDGYVYSGGTITCEREPVTMIISYY